MITARMPCYKIVHYATFFILTMLRVLPLHLFSIFLVVFTVTQSSIQKSGVVACISTVICLISHAAHPVSHLLGEKALC